MKYVLVKYKKLKLLINDEHHIRALLEHLSEIELLESKLSNFYRNLLSVKKENADELESERQILIAKIGYEIVGVPFTNHDAELYAIDKKLEYDYLDIEAGHL